MRERKKERKSEGKKEKESGEDKLKKDKRTMLLKYSN